jgi:hypothetical protein
MLGLLRSQGPVRLAKGRRRSSEHPDGLNGRDRIITFKLGGEGLGFGVAAEHAAELLASLE